MDWMMLDIKILYTPTNALLLKCVDYLLSYDPKNVSSIYLQLLYKADSRVIIIKGENG